MRLQYRIMLVAGILWFGGTAGLLILGALIHPLVHLVAIVWLVLARRPIRQLVLPTLFPSAWCRNCRRRISLFARWKCSDHYTDSRKRHVLAFHCNQGHEIGSFDCPNCHATIQIQKGNRRLFQRGKMADQTVSSTTSQGRGQGLLIGFDRDAIQGPLTRLLNWLRGKPAHNPVLLSDDVIGRHGALLGGTGMGKSTLIINLAKQLFERGDGATFLDPAGDLADDLLEHVPPDRVDDVIYIDVSDRESPFPFNLLHAHDDIERNNIVDEFMSVLRRLSQNWGDKIERQLRMALNVVLDTGGSLKDVYDLFTNARARERIVRRIKDPELIEYWTDTFPSTRYESRAAVITKLAPLVEHPLLGPILCARECAFNADDIIKNKRIVIVNLATGTPADNVTTVLGTFVVNKILAAAYRQESVLREFRTPHFFFIDEFQNFMHRASAFDRILSEARKYKLRLIVANQIISQFTDAVRDGIFGNVGFLTAFRVGHKDAGLLKDEFEVAGKRDVMSLTRGECLVRIGTRCVSVRTPPPPSRPANNPKEQVVTNMHELIRSVREDRNGKPASSVSEPQNSPEEAENADDEPLCVFV